MGPEGGRHNKEHCRGYPKGARPERDRTKDDRCEVGVLEKGSLKEADLVGRMF